MSDTLLDCGRTDSQDAVDGVRVLEQARLQMDVCHTHLHERMMTTEANRPAQQARYDNGNTAPE